MAIGGPRNPSYRGVADQLPNGNVQVFKPLGNLIEELEEIRDGAWLSLNGGRLMTLVPNSISSLAKENGVSEEEIMRDHDLKGVPDNAAMARREVEAGHPLALGQAIISTWAVLELHLREFQAQQIHWVRDPSRIPALANVKLTLAEYQGLNRETQSYFLLEVLERALQSSQKPGIERFEAVFDALGWSGPLDPKLKRNLLELHAVRNLMAHRHGLVDARFAAACPWLNCKAGDRHKVQLDQYLAYCESCLDYADVIFQRGRRIFERAERMLAEENQKTASQGQTSRRP